MNFLCIERYTNWFYKMQIVACTPTFTFPIKFVMNYIILKNQCNNYFPKLIPARPSRRFCEFIIKHPIAHSGVVMNIKRLFPSNRRYTYTRIRILGETRLSRLKSQLYIYYPACARLSSDFLAICISSLAFPTPRNNNKQI